MNSTPSSFSDDPVSFWSDEANIEEIHHRFLMGEKLHVPPRPGCNLSPEWSFPQAMAQLEQVTRRPTPATPNVGGIHTPKVDSTSSVLKKYPPNIGSLQLSQKTDPSLVKKGSVAFSPRRPLYATSANGNERVRTALTPKVFSSSANNVPPKESEYTLRQQQFQNLSFQNPSGKGAPPSVERPRNMPPSSSTSSAVRSLFPGISASNVSQVKAPPVDPVPFPQGLPSNEELLGRRQEKAAATTIRLRNQRPVDPDLIFGTANYEVPLKKIFASFKEATLFVKNDQRGISGDWNLDNFDVEEESDYKKAVGIQSFMTES
ncbi:transporter [Perkinsela sp. CCAP 1560/4]|nr:transporter [Perkinsela sp. CCAP 1560/4]|eukprot:KNH09723.1 transporter [Perkinsela sp. CCAP 1560/4]